jgi:iron complex transport system permease protein
VPTRPLEAIAQDQRDTAHGAKTCSRCGRQFGCRHGEPGCWCESVELRRETLGEIRALADDCLCPSCLAHFARRDRDEAASTGTSASAAERRGTWAKAIPDATIRARGVPPVWGLSAAVFLLCALMAGLAIGPLGIGTGAIAGSALSHLPVLHVSGRLDSIDEAILWQVRAPRVVLAALVGGMLAIAGSAYQGVFRNPLADPYLLGVAAGAGLGATLAIAYAGVGTGELLPLAAFVGAVVGVAAAYVLGRSAGGASSAGALILAGVAVAAFMTAAQTFLQQQNTESLREVYSWLLGGFSTADWHEVALVTPWVVVSSAVILAHRRTLDVLSVGDEEAGTLGMNVRRVRLAIVVAATAGTAAAVAVSGLIGFVGIIVPHTIRLLVSSSYRAIVPLSLVAGAGFLVVTDIVARTALSPAEVPIGVVTAFLGAPFFAVVLRKSRAADL